ncbi:hypothetical protein [Bradyrhizobium sp. CCBAU 53380]|uniref:hypothetical protein n=1 Tax=Bradyrhizobium sp. CCBAU 53380 TaxID=1325117 RepID=UPI002303BED4|nr:hypothetical protein [Bradyrhizobium sp. CCBAU 53380]MDA9421029.1 hypothetical protein [Bradyrhizobium sp. CCBAU 53380]
MKLARSIQINTMLKLLPASPVPLSLLQQLLWLLLRQEGRVRQIQMEHGLSGELEEAPRQPILDALVARHEVLRTTFMLECGGGIPPHRACQTAAEAGESEAGSG